MRLSLLLPLILVARTASANPDCTCANLKEIEYRMREINVIIANLKAEIAKVGSPGPQFTESAYNAFETSTQQVAVDKLKTANPGSPHTGAGRTDPASCNSEFPSNLSKCLLHALQAHESHHATVCHTVKGSYGGTTAPLTDYRNQGTLAAAYQEEITSYYVELDDLAASFRDLPDSCKPKDWYLKWTLSINGQSDSKSKIKWKIHHEYAGQVLLTDMGQVMSTNNMQRLTPQQAKQMTPQQAMALVKQMKKLHTWAYKAPPPQIMVPIEVTIADSTKWTSHDHGEGKSFENTTTESTWTATSVADEIQNYIQLEVDDQGKTYNITIPYAPMSSTKSLTESETVEVERSPFGWGNKPTHEGPTTTPKSLTVNTLHIPTNATVMSNGHVHHDKDLAFQPKEDMLVFDSGDLPIDPSSTFLDKLPGARDNVKIRVSYVLSKHPVN